MKTSTTKRHWQWLIVTIAGLFIIGSMTVSPAAALEFDGGDQVIVERDQVIDDDYYVGGSSIVIDGTITGDLFAGAQELIINGTVEGDVMAYGQTIIINGRVGDDVRTAAQVITLGEEAEIGGDLLAGGFSLENKPGSVIGGDVAFGGYQVLAGGRIGDDLLAGVGAFDLRGSVGGDVNVDIGVVEAGGPPPTMFMPQDMAPIPTVALGLTIAESASVDGDISYTLNQDGDISPAADIGGQISRSEPTIEETTAQRGTWPIVRRVLALVVMALLLMWLLPNRIQGLANTIEARPLPVLLRGVIAFFGFIALLLFLVIVTIALAVILGFIALGDLSGIIIFGGLILAALLIFGYTFFTNYAAYVIVGLLGGRLILGHLLPTQASGRYVPVLVGVIVLGLLVAIPFLGGLIGLFVVLFGLGSLWMMIRGTSAPQAKDPVVAGLG